MSLVSKSLKYLDLKLSHAEFDYNKAPSYATLHSPFEWVYGVEPLTPISVLSIPSELRVSHDAKVRAKEMKWLYDQIRGYIE